jgi:hypothetical protein
MLSYCMGSGVSQQPKTNEEWIYLPNNNIETCELDIGKWIFVFPYKEMEKYWNIAKDLYNHRGPDLKIIGVKCLNVFSGPFTILKEGVIMFFFDESSNNEKIINDGYRLLKTLKYSHHSYIKYKNNNSVYLYEINNRLYKSKCKLCLTEITEKKYLNRDICIACMTIRTNTLEAIVENDETVNNNFVKD